jgi:hypothetical protein
VSFLLDRADGELARQTGKCSAVGHRFDLCSDYAANATIFLGLGLRSVLNIDKPAPDATKPNVPPGPDTSEGENSSVDPELLRSTGLSSCSGEVPLHRGQRAEVALHKPGFRMFLAISVPPSHPTSYSSSCPWDSVDMPDRSRAERAMNISRGLSAARTNP